MYSNTKRNFKIYLFTFILTFLALTLFFPVEKVKAYKGITAIEVRELVCTPNSDTIIIDVRTPQEYKSGHIHKAVNIPLQVLNEEITKKNISKNTKIIVYCKSGFRSKKAAQVLDELGFANVYLLGGISDWPYSLVKD